MFIMVTLGLAAFRIYLEIVGFNFMELPISKQMSRDNATHFHRMGFIFSVGYIVLFAPSVLLGHIVIN